MAWVVSPQKSSDTNVDELPMFSETNVLLCFKVCRNTLNVQVHAPGQIKPVFTHAVNAMQLTSIGPKYGNGSEESY